jgi:hypothetical protein
METSMRPGLSASSALVGLLATATVSTGEAKPAKKESRIDYSMMTAGGPGVSHVVRDK